MALKDQELISYLNSCSSPATAKEIADHFDISVRSVKYTVSSLAHSEPGLIHSSSKGYTLNKELAKKLLQSKKHTDGNTSVPANYEARERFIINRLLLENRQESIVELAESLCISETTLQNELSRMRLDLDNYHLNIHVKNDIVTITGLEKDKRTVIMKFLYDEVQNSAFSLESIQKIFTSVDLKIVRKIIIDTMNDHEYFLDDYSLINYVLHIALTIEVHSNSLPYIENRDNISPVDLMKLGSPHIHQIVDDLYLRLKQVYKTDYDLADIYEASVLMMTRAVSEQFSSISPQNLGSIIGPDIKSLLDEITVSVEKTYGIRLSNESFQVRFGFHLKNLIIRLQNNLKITNLEFDSIKNNYPLIYAISVHISNIITHQTGLAMPEDEIGYIALHIGVLIEENNAIQNKVSCVLIAPDYNGMGKSLFKKLNNIFSESMLLTNVLTSYEVSPSTDAADLILSTIPLPSSVGNCHKIIQPFLSEKDIREIFSLLDEIKEAKIKNVFRKKIQYFFHDDLFFFQSGFLTSEDAIETMCDKMAENEYVAKNYKNQIYEHEKISSSSYGNVAIPHPLNNEAKSSVIALAISPEPISWGFNKVNLVFMLSLKEEDKELFSDIFEFITKIIKDPQTFGRIMKASTFNDFINILVSLY